MKNRIWKRLLAAGVWLLAETGLLVGCTAQPAAAGADESENKTALHQEAAWTDLEKFKGRVSVKAEGLSELVWESKGEMQTEEEMGFTDENSEIFTGNNTQANSYELVVWLSEYLQPDPSFVPPEGCSREELPVNTADGRFCSITGFRWRINPGESEKVLDIPVTLREEYRFPMEKTVIPTCQDTLYANSALSEAESGGVYILKKSGNEAALLCKTVSQNLEIPKGNIDFSIQMSRKEEKTPVGKRICMEVELFNKGQVPLYGISLVAQAKEIEAVPVWEKEPGLEISEKGAILESLAAGETRTASFYVDPDEKHKENITLQVQAQIDAPVLMERTDEQQITMQPLKAAFTVKKTADREKANPGDTVTYQISIHNTGEQTLHSVITTERFGLAGITAVFLEKEGVTLNRSKTQAKIPEIAPGGCVNLKARVVLPEDLKDQELVNQIIVVTDETGEEKAVRDQAAIQVEAKKDQKGNDTGSGSDDADKSSKSAAPKTGDRSHKELFQALILLSFFFSAVSARRMFFRRKD